MFRQVVCTTGRLGTLVTRHNASSLVLKRRNTAVAATQTVQDEWSTAKPYEEMPGPKPIPLLGNAWRFIPYIGSFPTDFSLLFEFLYKNYGPILKVNKLPGKNDMVVVYNPEDIEKVYRNEGPWPVRVAMNSAIYYRKVLRKDIFEGVGGALITQGEEWQNFRTKVNQVMIQPRSTKLYVQPIDAVAGDFIKRIRSIRNKELEMPKDFVNELCKWALESVTHIALDTRLGCLVNDLKPDSEPQKMIDAVQVLFESMYKLDIKVSPWRVISTPQWRKFVKAGDYFNDVCVKYINESMKRLKSLPADSNRELTIVEKILARDPNPKTAVVMAIDMMSAGVDTTAFQTAIILYYLAKNPDKQEKAFQEISSYVKHKDQPLTSEILNELRYLKACIKEAMRLQPVGIAAGRTLVKDMVLSGYKVPKGCDVVMPTSFLCRMDKYFPDAEKYLPERWLKDSDGTRSESKATHPFVFMPFGFGARMCLGKRFADLEMETLLAKMIRNFRIEYNHGEMKYQFRLFMVPASPLQFKLTDRD